MDIVVGGVVFCLLVVLVLRRQLGGALALSTAKATTWLSKHQKLFKLWKYRQFFSVLVMGKGLINRKWNYLMYKCESICISDLMLCGLWTTDSVYNSIVSILNLQCFSLRVPVYRVKMYFPEVNECVISFDSMIAGIEAKNFKPCGHVRIPAHHWSANIICFDVEMR